MARRLPDTITKSDIVRAFHELDAGRSHNFADSTEYDVLFEGRRYPPKAVVGVAAELITGQRYVPRDFSGGLDSKCFRILDGAGFEVVEKEALPATSKSLRPTLQFDSPQEEAFHEEMISLYARTGAATGGAYWPHRFMQSVKKHGGLVRAKKLLSANAKSDGFERLAEVNRADLSVEALVLEPRFSSLFTKEELAIAEKRLSGLPSSAFPTEAGKPAERLAEELPDDEDFIEGAATKVKVNRYERDQKARAACLKHFGAICQVCGLDFAERYGADLGEGFMHVHHKRPIHTLKAKYKVKPKKDLVPVCPNCHAMLHRKEPPLDVEQLRARLNAQCT
jgi:5-methylcytosine-specific restriction protein A